ncbi:hypothetical protein CerSpe_265360 [Prunus speciosa]
MLLKQVTGTVSGISFPASAVDSTLCTRLFLAFADVNPKTNQVIISPQDQPQFSNFTRTVQQRNPFVKTLLSIGGASASTTATDMTNFRTLLAEWQAAVTNESKTFGKPPLLLVAAVYYSATYNSLLHPIQSIKNNLDWINVMAYSFFAPGWSPNVTGPPASLYSPISPISGDSGITAWLQAAEEMAVRPDGSAGYNLIKEYIAENGASTVFNSTLVMDYSYTGKTWIGYDDTQSITSKISYAKGKGLVGYFAWNLHAHGEHIRDTTLATFPINKKMKM